MIICLSGTCLATEATDTANTDFTDNDNQENGTMAMDITETIDIEEEENQESDEDIMLSSDKWFYQQLNELEKIVYDGFAENKGT